MRIDDKPREECAVFGVSTRTGGAAALTMNGLLTLQHRGQEGAGIAVAQDGGILCHKDAGLVGEVFTPAAMEALAHAKTAVGHTRYSTTGASTRENAGPFVSEYLTGRLAAAITATSPTRPPCGTSCGARACIFRPPATARWFPS